jgi:hypothetical protein
VVDIAKGLDLIGGKHIRDSIVLIDWDSNADGSGRP